MPLLNKRLNVASSPHFAAVPNTRSVMLDVLIALVPALVMAVYFFGFRALTLTLVSVGACVFFEWGYRKLLHKSNTVGDLSACVTGVLMAMCLPVTVPNWMANIGAFFANEVVKQLFGGLGENFMNPALGARAFLMMCYPAVMTVWVTSGTWVSLISPEVDGVTGATPLSYMKSGLLPEGVTLRQMLLGQTGGCLGEVCALLLIAGGIYLVANKVISPRIPLVYVGTVAVLTFLFPLGGQDRLMWMLYNVLGGGLLLGAIFMATDYVSSPVTPKGQIFYALGCGLLTVLIRYFGGYPEGVSYAILIMNVCAPLLDKAGKPRRFGLVKEKKKEGADT